MKMLTFNLQQAQAQRLLVALLSLVMGLALSACGDSQAYYAQDELGAEQLGPIDGKGDQVDGKADRPAQADFQLSGHVIRFDGDGEQAMIALEPAGIMDAFGQGGSLLKHNALIRGVTISWDGQPTQIYMRARNDNYQGEWTLAQVMAEQTGSYRVYFESDISSYSLDMFIVQPDGIDFMLIEPVYAQ